MGRVGLGHGLSMVVVALIGGCGPDVFHLPGEPRGSEPPREDGHILPSTHAMTRGEALFLDPLGLFAEVEHPNIINISGLARDAQEICADVDGGTWNRWFGETGPCWSITDLREAASDGGETLIVLLTREEVERPTLDTVIAAAGDYTLTLNLTDDAAITTWRSMNITLREPASDNHAPTVRLSTDAITMHVGDRWAVDLYGQVREQITDAELEAVHVIDAIDSFDPDGSIEYLWHDLVDGSTGWAAYPYAWDPVLTYVNDTTPPGPGQYTLAVQMIDATGAIGQASVSVTILP